MHGIRTPGGMMEGADESTEQKPTTNVKFFLHHQVESCFSKTESDVTLN